MQAGGGGGDLIKGLMNVWGKKESKNTNQCFLLYSYPFGFNFFSGKEEEEEKKNSPLSVASV